MAEKDSREPPPGFSGVWKIETYDGHFREFTYVDGVREGPWRSIHSNGVIQRECVLRDGQYHGEMIVRDSDGKVLDRSVFVDDTGIYNIFTSDGRLGWKIPLRHGKRHGMVGRLWEGKWIEEEWRDGTHIDTKMPRLT